MRLLDCKHNSLFPHTQGSLTPQHIRLKQQVIRSMMKTLSVGTTFINFCLHQLLMVFIIKSVWSNYFTLRIPTRFRYELFSKVSTANNKNKFKEFRPYKVYIAWNRMKKVTLGCASLRPLWEPQITLWWAASHKSRNSVLLNICLYWKRSVIYVWMSSKLYWLSTVTHRALCTAGREAASVSIGQPCCPLYSE